MTPAFISMRTWKISEWGHDVCAAECRESQYYADYFTFDMDMKGFHDSLNTVSSQRLAGSNNFMPLKYWMETKITWRVQVSIRNLPVFCICRIKLLEYWILLTFCSLAGVLLDKPSLSPRLGGVHHCTLSTYELALTIDLLQENYGVQKLDTWIFNLFYGHHARGRESNLKFTCYYGPLENLDPWIEVCQYGHHLIPSRVLEI
jgi:hypothetical protein